MAAYLKDDQQIAFGTDANWVRADRYDNGVGFDHSGLHQLDADECRELGTWLLLLATHLPPKAEPAKPKRGRKVRTEPTAEAA